MARRNSRFVNQKIIIGNKSIQTEDLTDSALDIFGVGDDLPSGTKLLFQQTAAPIGWTKDTTHNDKALRVVSGTASNGGVDSFSTTFGAGKTTASHTLSTPQIPAHTHSYQGGGIQTGSGTDFGWARYNLATGRNSGSTGGNGAHSHDLSLDIAYVDVIIATKD